jgi:hypothetical protein
VARKSISRKMLLMVAAFALLCAPTARAAAIIYIGQEQQHRGYLGNTRKALCKLPTKGPGGFFQVLKADQLANPLPNGAGHMWYTLQCNLTYDEQQANWLCNRSILVGQWDCWSTGPNSAKPRWQLPCPALLRPGKLFKRSLPGKTSYPGT